MMTKRAYSELPDGGWGWMIVLAGFLNTCLFTGIVRSFSVFFLHFTQHFQETSSRVSWIASIAVATHQFASPIGSAFGKRYEARSVVMVGGILASMGMFFGSFGQSLLHMYLSIGLLTGFGWALAFTPTMTMISRYFKKRRALATGLAFTGTGIASFFFSPLFQFLIDEYFWRGALLILSAIMLNFCVCAALLRPIHLQEDHPDNPSKHSENGAESSGFWDKVTSAFDLTLMLHRGFVVYTLAVTLMTVGYFVPYVHLVAHGKNIGLTDYEAAFLLSVIAITSTASRLVSGWVADLNLLRSIHWFLLCSILAGISILLLPVGHSYSTLMGLCIFYGFCDGILSPLIFSTLPDIVGIGRTLNATGLFLMFLSIGGLFGPPLSGMLEDKTGSYSTSFIVAGVFMLAGSLVLLLLPGFFVCTTILSKQQTDDPVQPGAQLPAAENNQS